MKRTVILTLTLLLLCFAFSACTAVTPDPPTSDDTGIPEHAAATPAFLSDIGKSLRECKQASPDGAFAVSLDGFPDFAAACFGEPNAEYLTFFFGGHDGDFEKAMKECEEQLKCAGFVTTAGVLFPEMQEEMTFEAFFSLLGVEEYEYFGEDVITAKGWLQFSYRGMEVMIDTTEADTKTVRRDAPASIVDTEISSANQDLADAVMFD